MKPPVETVRVSERGREILLKLKRRTGIEHWNVLCRWAFCSSLADSTTPTSKRLGRESNLEMSWKVFGGEIADVLICLLRARAIKDGIKCNEDSLVTYFRMHLERGILQIQNVTGLADLAETAQLR